MGDDKIDIQVHNVNQHVNEGKHTQVGHVVSHRFTGTKRTHDKLFLNC